MLEIKKIFESGTEFRIMIPTDWLVFAWMVTFFYLASLCGQSTRHF
jgi:hypothetical protein